jgi:hypothetical protein
MCIQEVLCIRLHKAGGALQIVPPILGGSRYYAASQGTGIKIRIASCKFNEHSELSALFSY